MSNKEFGAFLVLEKDIDGFFEKETLVNSLKEMSEQVRQAPSEKISNFSLTL